MELLLNVVSHTLCEVSLIRRQRNRGIALSPQVAPGYVKDHARGNWASGQYSPDQQGISPHSRRDPESVLTLRPRSHQTQQGYKPPILPKA